MRGCAHQLRACSPPSPDQARPDEYALACGDEFSIVAECNPCLLPQPYRDLHEGADQHE